MRITHLLFAVALSAGSMAAQGIADKQEQARQRFAALHGKMQELQVVLSTTAPEESRVLKVGNRHVQEARIQEDLDGVGALLQAERWDEALERMGEVKRDIEELVSLLQNKNVDLEKLLAEIERLSQFRDRVDKLIDEQAREKRASAETEALEQHLRDLEAAKAKVSELLAEQTKLRDATSDAGLNVGPKGAEMAERQGELKKQAEELGEQLDKVAKDADKLGKPDGDAKPAQPKEDDAKEDGKAEAKDGQGKGEGGSGKCAGSCQSAAQAMGESQQDLQANKPEASLEDQQKAIEKLQEALADLEKLSEEARRKLLQIPFEQQVKAQEHTQAQTSKLGEDMEAGEQGEDGKPTPGKKNVQQSVPKQKAAAGQLKERKPGKAKQDQQDAQDELEQAKKELEDALAQLRQEMQDQVLRALEERLSAMLAKQRELSALTKVTDRLKGEALTASTAVPASIQERCAKESKGEAGLASESHDAIKLLEEDGTTAVFPAMFADLEQDLTQVSDLLAKCETGTATQDMQRRIEELMAMLLDALKKQIEDGGH
jgi:hypothetical protein